MTIFTDDAERTHFLAALERVCRDASARLFAYCLMGNHFHAAVETAGIPLSTIMQRLLTSYAAHFNRRHGRVGHLFQGRHKAFVCANEAYLQRVIRYIHQNPVRAGLVKEARNWRWSSAGDFSDDGSGDDFGGFDPWREDARSVPAPRRGAIKSSVELDVLAQAVSARTGVPITLLRSTSRLRWVVSAKRALAVEAVRSGHRMLAVAGWMNTSHSTVSNYLATC